MIKFEELNATILDSDVRDELKRIVDYANDLESRVDQLQVQLAGCSIAAFGGTRNPAKQGDYGWSPAYQDVLSLRQKYDDLLDEKVKVNGKTATTMTLECLPPEYRTCSPIPKGKIGFDN